MKWKERPQSGTYTLDPPTLTQEYVLQYNADEFDDYTVAYATSLTLTPLQWLTPNGILFRQDVVFKKIGFKVYHVTVPSGRVNKQGLNVTFSGTTTGGTVNQQAGVHVATFPNTAANHNGLIGVHDQGGGIIVDGVDVITPILDFQIDITYPAGVMTTTYAKFLFTLTGKVNSTSFYDWAIGEVIYRGANFKDGTYTPVEISHHFSMSPNIVGATIAGLTGINKYGWDVGWIEYAPDAAGGNKKGKAKAFHVDRVYQYVDLRALLGFG